MNKLPDNTLILMLCERVENLPQFTLPHPYFVRWYAEGDEDNWHDIKTRADIYHQANSDYYQRVYHPHAALLPQRQAYLCDEAGRAVGTVTGWFDEFNNQRYGKIDWILIVPEAQGTGWQSLWYRLSANEWRPWAYTDLAVHPSDSYAGHQSVPGVWLSPRRERRDRCAGLDDD